MDRPSIFADAVASSLRKSTLPRVPNSPPVKSTIPTFFPLAMCFSKVPPQPNSTSSGWAPKASKSNLCYEIKFHPLISNSQQLIFEDAVLEVYTIPLKHRIYCNGFLFKEKKKEKRLSKELIAKYKIPVEMMPKLKKGEDWGSFKNE